MFKDPPIICAEERIEMVGDPPISLNTTHNLTQVLGFKPLTFVGYFSDTKDLKGNNS